jgi:hypothetical protein
MDPEQRAKIQDLLEKGWDSRAIAREIGVSIQAVAAVRAHRTMGTYTKSSAVARSSQNRERITNWVEPSDPTTQLELPLQNMNTMIDKLENNIRDHIDVALSAKSKNYLELIPSDVLQSAERKVAEHFKRHPYEKKQHFPNRRWLDYMDIMDYNKIILLNWSCFEAHFGSKGEVEKHFSNLKEVRNALKHGRQPNSVTRKQGEASMEWLDSILNSNSM